ncbi:LCP family protein [Streptomyces parvus]|uniref:LytR family transcriptional regulator n=1 Tax=Streptomyces parvus TaxID=66428 RepID=A0A5D4I5D3_9ACTN|nr:LCP family protein [Streptomyces parvus]TYR48216.1 LytR family transcriptional regulator [Streptomyces parvus]
MDADVTDSAGPPSDPDRPEATEGGGQQDGTPQDGTPESGSPQSGTPQGDVSQEKDPAAAEADTADGAGAAGPEAEAGEADAASPGEAAAGSEPAAGPVRGEADGVQTWADQPKDGILAARRSHWLRWTALAASFLVLIAAGVGWWMYKKLDGNITTDTGAVAELKAYEKERPTPVVVDAQNILLIGSDSRAGDNREYGRDDGGSQRSDTTILLHLAADRKSATAVSIPRDLMVEIPSCRTADDKKTRERFTQFNSAFELGGTACTIRTVERMTGIRIDHHMVVDFNGFKDMVDAVDGVEICLKEPINDKDARLELPAGRQTLNGEEALGYVRARKSLGNGSDTERMERQQQFLGALVNKMQSNGVLLNPTRLYPVLDAATKSLTTDPGLASLRDLYDLVRGMRDVPTEQVQFLTVPRQPYRNDPNRDELVEPDAGDLFKQLREDKPVAVVPADELEEAEREQESGRDGKPDDAASESPTPTPTYSGSSAADDLCKQ